MSLDLYVGCMRAGKSTTIGRLYHEYTTEQNLKVLCINYRGDDRYTTDDYVFTHSGQKTKCLKVFKLGELCEELINGYDVIMIDEGQFFPDLFKMVSLWVEKYHKHVVVLGLDGDYKRESFGQIGHLLPLCDNVTKLKAHCQLCKELKPAIFTAMKNPNNHSVFISNEYLSLCRQHYLSHMSQFGINN